MLCPPSGRPCLYATGVKSTIRASGSVQRSGWCVHPPLLVFRSKRRRRIARTLWHSTGRRLDAWRTALALHATRSRRPGAMRSRLLAERHATPREGYAAAPFRDSGGSSSSPRRGHDRGAAYAAGRRRSPSDDARLPRRPPATQQGTSATRRTPPSVAEIVAVMCAAGHARAAGAPTPTERAPPARPALRRADGRRRGAATGPRSRRRGAGRSLRRTAVHPRTSAIGPHAGDRPTRVHRASLRLQTVSGRCVGPASNRRAHPGTHSQSTSPLRESRSSGWRSNTRRRRPAPASRRTDARP